MVRIVECTQTEAWDGLSSNIPAYIEIICDLESELSNDPTSWVSGYSAVIGSKAHVVSNQLDYEMKSNGVWEQVQSQDLVSIINTLSNLDAEVSNLGDNVDTLFGAVGVIKEALEELVDDCKNKIILLPSMSTSVGSLDFIVNNDGTVTLNGTNDTGSTAFFSAPITIPPGNYVFNGMQETGGTSSYRQELRATPGGAVYQLNDNENYTTFMRTADYNGYYSIRVANGYSANNVVIKPMIALEKFIAVSTKFKAGAPTNRQLYELIRGYHP